MKTDENLTVGVEYGLPGTEQKAEFLGTHFNEDEGLEFAVFRPVDENTKYTQVPGSDFGFPDQETVIPLWNGPDLYNSLTKF